MAFDLATMHHVAAGEDGRQLRHRSCLLDARLGNRPLHSSVRLSRPLPHELFEDDRAGLPLISDTE